MSNRFRKTKVTIGIVYLVLLAVYVFFLFTNFTVGEHGENVNFFGTCVYTTENSGSAYIGNPSLPVASGEQIAYKLDDGTGIASVYSVGFDGKVYLDEQDPQKSLQASSIYAVVTSTIPFLGAILKFLLSSWGIIFIVLIPCFIFLVYQVILLIRSIRDKQTDKELNRYKSETLYKNSEREQENQMPSKHNFESFNQSREKQEDTTPLISPTTSFSPLKPPIRRDASLQKTISEMKYKMQFQDTRELSKQVESIIQEDEEKLTGLEKYGLQTFPIKDGVEIQLDPKTTGVFRLRLSNDGSLEIITDTFTANIHADQ